MSEEEIIENLKDIKRVLRGDTINRYITSNKHYKTIERNIRFKKKRKRKEQK